VLSAERIDRVARAFRERTGREPEGVWCAPGRVNLIGEHTDYNNGLVLPFAIDRQVIAAVGLRDDGRLSAWSGQGAPEGWLAYPRGVLRALRDAGVAAGQPVGADIAVDSDVPIGAGLASSAALACAIAMAVSDLAGGGLSKLTLALACQSAENTEAGAQTGLMDQVAALFAEAGRLVHFDVRSREIALIPGDFGDLVLIVIDTGVRHSIAASAYGVRRRECAQAAEILGVATLRESDLGRVALLAGSAGREGSLGRRARHVFTENARVTRAVALLQAGRVDEVGPLLTASHASLRDDFEVSVPELDVAVDAAVEGGALGARMTGGGFGGCALALARTDDVAAVRLSVERAYGRLDWPPPQGFRVSPAAGARRLR
jgi:galactokinase